MSCRPYKVTSNKYQAIIYETLCLYILIGAKAFLDGERYLEIKKPLPDDEDCGDEKFLLKTRLVGVFKKGSGAIVESEAMLTDENGEVYVTMYATTFAVGAKNVVNSGISHAEVVKPPKRMPDSVLEMPTSPYQTHIYRLSGKS